MSSRFSDGRPQPQHGRPRPQDGLKEEPIKKNPSKKSQSSDSKLSDEEQIRYIKQGTDEVHRIPVATIRGCLQLYTEDIIAETIHRMHLKEIGYPEQYAIGIAEKVALEKKQKGKRHDTNGKGKNIRGRDSERGVPTANKQSEPVQYVRYPMEYWRGDESVQPVRVNIGQRIS
jgi:hypothetical protein